MRILTIIFAFFLNFSLLSCDKAKLNDPTPTESAASSDSQASAPRSNFELVSARPWRLKTLEDTGRPVALTAVQLNRVYSFNSDSTYLERDRNVIVKQGTWSINTNELPVTSNRSTNYYVLVELTRNKLIYDHIVSNQPYRVLRYEFGRK